VCFSNTISSTAKTPEKSVTSRAPDAEVEGGKKTERSGKNHCEKPYREPDDGKKRKTGFGKKEPFGSHPSAFPAVKESPKTRQTKKI